MLPRPLIASASALLVSLIATPAVAQLHTNCNPTLKTCPADPAFSTDYTFIFNSTPAVGLWNTSAGTVTYDAENGAAFTIAEKGYSPTLTSNFYFFWGRTEVIMKAANGTGIISSIVYGSDDLDEVDWEFKGTDTTQVQSNYYGKAVTNTTSGGTHNVTGSVQTEWHNYTNVWTKDKLEWWIDGTLARTLLPAAANDTRNYPQTPMKLMLGIWAGGDSSQAPGTIEWAGGATVYDDGPYTMYVKSARVEDYSSGASYSYGDMSGNWTSIKINDPNTTSTAVTNLNNAATEAEEAADNESIGEKWDNLPSSTKTGVYAAAGGVGAIGVIALAAYYIKQRRRGQQEAALAAANMERERLELEQFKKEGRSPDGLSYEGADYDATSMRKDGMMSTTAYSVPGSRNNSLHSLHAMPAANSGWDPTAASAASPGVPARNNSLGPGSPLQSPTGAPARMGSPGPQVGGYSRLDRINSSGSVQSPPGRSLSSPRSPGGYEGANNGYFDGNGHRS